jgi:hypothetical protein
MRFSIAKIRPIIAIFLYMVQLCVKNIEGCEIKRILSHLDFSQIWLNLHVDDLHSLWLYHKLDLLKFHLCSTKSLEALGGWVGRWVEDFIALASLCT